MYIQVYCQNTSVLERPVDTQVTTYSICTVYTCFFKERKLSVKIDFIKEQFKTIQKILFSTNPTKKRNFGKFYNIFFHTQKKFFFSQESISQNFF